MPREVWKWLLSLDLPIQGNHGSIKLDLLTLKQSPIPGETCKMGKIVHIYFTITVALRDRKIVNFERFISSVQNAKLVNKFFDP